MSYIAFAWIASIIYSVNSIFAKLISKYQLKNVSQYSFFMIFFSALFSGIIALLNGATLPSNWTFVVLAGLFLSLANILYLKVLKTIDLSVFSAVFNLRVVISIILGFVILGEKINSQNIWIMILIIIAGIFASMDEKFSFKSFFSKSIILGIVFVIVLVVQNIFVNRASASTNYWTVILWMGIFASIFSFIFLFYSFKKDVADSKISDYLGVMFLSLLGTFGDLAAYKAFSGNVSLSTIIISIPFSMILVFLLSFVKPELLEKHSLKVYVLRFAMVGIMIWGRSATGSGS
ncbi:MAG: EamA family transporter [bacterium]|nr:EamA family transporter [bacterium]